MSIFLTCNAGSTNTKLAAFDAVTLERKGHTVTHNAAETVEWLCAIGTLDIAAIGHRVVHGGRAYTHPEPITGEVLAKLKSYIPLAPLHQPAAIALIEQTQKYYPGVPAIACFDTAFHHTITDNERRLPLPPSYYDEGIMRYGFHGLSYDHIATVLPDYAGDAAAGHFIVVHLGGGASACAMRNRQSVASTMGFSTLDGLMMGTRCGAIDPGVLLYLLAEKNMPLSELSNLLYHHAGLKGMSGLSADMKTLLASNSPAAAQAIDQFCLQAAKQIAALLPSLGGLDGLVYTGGIGEQAGPIRDKITDLLRGLSEFPVYVIPTDEELVIAKACRRLTA